MSKKCPKCGSIRIVEVPSGDMSICLACESLLNTIDGKSKQTLFDSITTSPEALAKASVYCLSSDVCRADDGKFTVKRNWKSPFIDRCYGTKEEAFAVTVEKLKEVEKDEQ